MARRKFGRMKPCVTCGTEFHCSPCKDVGGTFPEQRYCSKQCYWNNKWKDPDSFLWAKVDKSAGDDGCWPYTGSTDRRGYGRPGRAVVRGTETKRYYAHRRSYEIHVGPIPDGKLIMHTCDNPPCCNPKHLRIGTDAQNNADMRRKGRHAKGDEFPQAKLNADKVREIRQLLAAGKGRNEIAPLFGISANHVSGIKNGRYWAHLDSAQERTEGKNG